MLNFLYTWLIVKPLQFIWDFVSFTINVFGDGILAVLEALGDLFG